MVAVAGISINVSLKNDGRTFGEYRKSSSGIRKRWPPELQNGLTMKTKPLEQVHLCIGFKGVAAGHKNRYAVYALNSVLGGGVSSRLFQEVREKRGLSYSIYSFLSGYSDGGTITVYVGIRAREVERVVDLIYREIRKLPRHGIDGHELKAPRIK